MDIFRESPALRETQIRQMYVFGRAAAANKAMKRAPLSLSRSYIIQNDE